MFQLYIESSARLYNEHLQLQKPQQQKTTLQKLQQLQQLMVNNQYFLKTSKQ